MLSIAALFLAAAVIFVPLFQRFGLGAVLGYLAAGIVIGPSGLGLIGDVEAILHLSEFGVVLLLFVIGLELQPSRLWRLRHSVLGMGGAQVLLTTLALSAIAWGLGQAPLAALVAGFGLAMSSTAFALQLLGERKELTTRHGRASFAILLFQDIAVIPFLALLPMLAMHGAQTSGGDAWLGIARAAGAIFVVILGGRYLLRPVLRVLAATRMVEIFTAAALLVVIATALAMQAVGLSMSLGAFLAGMLLADSEYRHELQADIEPFKGLLLGLFFMAVGMGANVALLQQQPLLVLGLVAGLILVKAGVLYVVGRVAGLNRESARSLAFALPQGGEFAFVLFSLAVASGVIAHTLEDLLVVVVTLSMIASAPLYALAVRMRKSDEPRPYDEISVAETPVIIAGFGPFGQIIGRMLRVKKIPYTILEKNWEHVDFVRKLGSPIFYSDASRIEVLRAANADKAKIFVCAIAEPETSIRVVETVRQHFPHLKIYAMASTRRHAMQLMDLGIKRVIRRAYYSSLEMTRQLLMDLGESEQGAARSIEQFRRHDEATLLKQQAVMRDEKAVIQTAQQSARELEQLFESDKPQ